MTNVAFPDAFNQALDKADSALSTAENSVADNQPVDMEYLSHSLQDVAEIAKTLPSSQRLPAQPVLQSLLRRLDLIINQLVATADLYKEQRKTAHTGRQAAKAYVQARQGTITKPPGSDDG